MQMLPLTPDQASYDRWRRTAVIAWAILGVLIIAFLILYIIYSLRAVLQPFIYASAIVYILRPGVDFLENRGLPRIWSIFFVYLVLILVVTIILVFIIPVIIDEAQLLAKQIPSYIKNGQKMFYYYQEEIARIRVPREAFTALDSMTQQLKTGAIKFLSALPSTTANVFGGLFNILLAPIIAMYLLKDMRKIRLAAINLMPQDKQTDFSVIIQKIDNVLGGFIRGQMTVAIVVGILISIGLAALRIDFALIIGIFAGFFNLIPYMGPVFGAIPAVIIAVIKFGGWHALAVIAMFAFVQLLDNILITPNVMRHHVGLPPVLVIFSLLTGGLLLGLLGMLIIIPIVAACKAIIDYLLEKRIAAQ